MKRLLMLALVLTLIAGMVGPLHHGESDVAVAEGERVKLKIYNQPQDDAAEEDWILWEDFCKRLEEKFPNVEFEWTRLAPGTDYRQQFDQLLMAGDGYTVGLHFPYVDIQSRIENKTIANINEFVENWDLRKEGKVNTTFDHALTDQNGEWYAVPGAPYVNGIVYNKQVIEEAGGDSGKIPTTWSEFAELAAKYTDKEIPRFGYLLLGSDFNAWTFTPWVWSAGGEMVRDNGDGTWEVAFNEDPGIDAAMFMNSLVWEHNATQKDILEPYDDMQNHFKAGQAAYGWGAPPQFGVEDLARFDQTQENIGFFPLPGKDEGGRVVSFAGGEVYTISPLADDAQRKAAWEYIQYVSYDEEFLISRWELENSYGRLSANPSVRTDLVEKKYSMATNWPAHWAQEMAAATESALPEPYCPNWNQLKDEIVKPLQTIYLTEGITREEAKKLLDDCAETLYVKYPESFRKPQ